MKRFVADLRLRSTAGDRGRKVTWLELFFDLIFVAAVAQVAALISSMVTPFTWAAIPEISLT